MQGVDAKKEQATISSCWTPIPSWTCSPSFKERKLCKTCWCFSLLHGSAREPPKINSNVINANLLSYRTVISTDTRWFIPAKNHSNATSVVMPHVTHPILRKNSISDSEFPSTIPIKVRKNKKKSLCQPVQLITPRSLKRKNKITDFFSVKKKSIEMEVEVGSISALFQGHPNVLFTSYAKYIHSECNIHFGKGGNCCLEFREFSGSETLLTDCHGLAQTLAATFSIYLNIPRILKSNIILSYL